MNIGVPGNGIRKQILDILDSEPGLNKSEIRRRVGCSWGNLGHHLQALRTRGRIRFFRRGRELMVFPASIPSSHLRVLAALRSPINAELLPRLRNDRRSIQDLADATGRSRKLISRHLQELQSVGLLERQPGMHGKFQLRADVVDRIDNLQAWLGPRLQSQQGP